MQLCLRNIIRNNRMGFCFIESGSKQLFNYLQLFGRMVEDHFSWQRTFDIDDVARFVFKHAKSVVGGNHLMMVLSSKLQRLHEARFAAKSICALYYPRNLKNL